MTSSTLTFFGALQHVTGSMHLGQHHGSTWTIDCGMIQGSRKAEEANYGPWPVPPATIDLALLTHAHLDHCGRLPRLVREGFSGPIYASRPSKELAQIILLDSAKLSKEEAKYRRKIALRKGGDPEADPFTNPLYTDEEVKATMRQFQTQPIGGQWKSIRDGIDFRFHDAGHIIGSCHVELRLTDARGPVNILYSGDIGRYGVPLLRDPVTPDNVDLIVMESTYGDRLHPEADILTELARAINETYDRGGIVLIPAFAVSRTQSILWHIAELERERRIPIKPVFLDSPMARQTTALYRKYPGVLDPPRPGMDQFGTMQLPKQFSEVINRKDSKRLNERHHSCIIVAASGMLSGGRVLHHFQQRAPVRENLVLITGFQAPGTLGARVLGGADEVRIFGTDIPVRAEIRQIKGFSAHADQDELLQWARSFKGAPKCAFLVHGDPEAVESLKRRLETELKWRVEIPPFNEPLAIRDLL